MNKKRQKNFRDKIENFEEIKANIMHFWPIIKEIWIMIMTISKVIIQTIIKIILCNML